MRDPDRIDQILWLIRLLWKNYPDLRLGQLLFDFGDMNEQNIFYLEDDKLENSLRESIRKYITIKE